MCSRWVQSESTVAQYLHSDDLCGGKHLHQVHFEFALFVCLQIKLIKSQRERGLIASPAFWDKDIKWHKRRRMTAITCRLLWMSFDGNRVHLCLYLYILSYQCLLWILRCVCVCVCISAAAGRPHVQTEKTHGSKFQNLSSYRDLDNQELNHN